MMREAMPVAEALRVLAGLRGDDCIVVSHMGAAREWIQLSDHPLDLHYVPSAMGGGPPLALGLALAQPQREVWLLTGDGSLLMTLGALLTVIDSGARNLSLMLIDNAAYEIIGGPKTPATRRGVDFAGMARAAGFESVSHFRCLDDWRRGAAQMLAAPGPRFIWLEVNVVHENHRLDPPCPMQEQLTRLRRALGAAST
ncbi:MAG: thiamine pyrophosphate-binding protein [Planctomycetes bacterium]|nr:thiamine pyrophosphate-binding protein [Planctomycetota bacterium]